MRTYLVLSSLVGATAVAVDHALETACECVRPMPLVATDGRL